MSLDSPLSGAPCGKATIVPVTNCSDAQAKCASGALRQQRLSRFRRGSARERRLFRRAPNVPSHPRAVSAKSLYTRSQGRTLHQFLRHYVGDVRTIAAELAAKASVLRSSPRRQLRPEEVTLISLHRAPTVWWQWEAGRSLRSPLQPFSTGVESAASRRRWVGSGRPWIVSPRLFTLAYSHCRRGISP